MYLHSILLLWAYIYIWELLHWVCLLVRVCMWASWDSSICIHFATSFWVWKMNAFLLGTPSHCPLHHLICWWCGSSPCFDMSWSSFLLFVPCSTIILIIIFDPSHLFHMFVLFLHISLLIRSSSFFPYHHYIHIGHPQVHGSRDFLYICIFIHEGMSFDHWVFEPSFLSFLLPYHPNLHFVLCFETTLRPWDQMSSLTVSTWVGVWGSVDI